MEPVYLGVYGAWEYEPHCRETLGIGSARGKRWVDGYGSVRGTGLGLGDTYVTLLGWRLDSPAVVVRCKYPDCKSIRGGLGERLGGLADADIGLADGEGDRQWKFTEGVDGGGGSPESVLPGEACPISLVLGTVDQLWWGRAGGRGN